MFAPMFEPYRRDSISKTLFRYSEFLLGGAILSGWFIPMPFKGKVAFTIATMLVFSLAVWFCPPKPPKGD